MQYYSKDILKGFDSYKYNSRDTSPLAIYVMHPYWDWFVKIYPTWLAANTLTFIGFILVSANFLLISFYDWDFYASNPGHPEHEPLPSWVWWVMFVFHFGAHTLDGTDGKQAKRTNSSSPLGELFDHGVDSLSTIFMPVALFSIFGRNHYYGGDVYDMHYIAWCIFLTFALSHWEKYNTRELYLPWGYDIALLGIAATYVISGMFGIEFWRFDVMPGLPAARFLIRAVIVANFGLSFPVSLYNIYAKYSPVNQLKYGFWEGIKPLLSITLLAAFSTHWLFQSPNNIAEKEPRIFLWVQGVIFSSHVCRLIIAQMTSTKVQAIDRLLLPYMAFSSGICLLGPAMVPENTERSILWAFTIVASVAHFHFGVCVIQEIADYLKVPVFSVKPHKK